MQFRFEKLLWAGSILALSLVTGCAHTKSATNPDGSGASLSEVLSQDLNSIQPSQRSWIANAQPGELIVKGVKLENTQFDFPVVINSRVEYWVDYFTGKGRKHFTRYLERSEFFIPFIQPLLKQNGMPEDLVYLAMIESGFNNHARSHAKAVGPWQFISATGKRYGLSVNWWVDERRDTRKSTLAAVNYLKDLYSIFQSWELAASAYNAGEAKVARAIRRFGTKDFWVISHHRFLRPETRDYVPKIIAAAILAKNRTQFGFPAKAAQPHEGEAVAPDGALVKLEKENEAAQPVPAAQASADSLERILSEDDYEDAPEDVAPATLTVPIESQLPEGTLTKNGGEASSAPIARSVPTPSVSKKGEVKGEELAEFDVQSPADLLKVARAAGLSYQTVKSLNPELLRWATPPNQGSYRLKLPASVRDKFLVTYNHTAYPRKVTFLTYKVRRGETLSRIAGHFGIKVDPISQLNGVSSKTPLRTGLHVLLPMPNDRSRTLASLEVRDPPERRRFRRARRARTYKVSYKRRQAARVKLAKPTT